jgi:hypothetical protein
MTDEERKLFHELIVASRILVTVSRNAATVLSEEFEDMITGPASAVQSILDQCPQPDVAWDGVFREEDVTEELFTPEVGSEYVEYPYNSGVKLTHKQTQMSTESYQSTDVGRNRQRAMRVLKSRVELRVREAIPPP